jgi:hypothetical protein
MFIIVSSFVVIAAALKAGWHRIDSRESRVARTKSPLAIRRNFPEHIAARRNRLAPHKSG